MMLISFLLKEKGISYMGCATQLYFVMFLVTTECYLLGAVVYKRYMAIRNPLRYAVVMNRRLGLSLVLLSCLGGNAVSVLQAVGVFPLQIHGPNNIQYFSCDTAPFITLSCIDTSSYEMQT
ncbi:PREDICTED: olfactory receptor 10A7-like, partial [Tinamus guttatus]|uniref:olfactory receptor 10A7-like n=1 Tax=Tinamus guttatus TaxID=94827 RepID=UPI00052EC53A